MTLRNFGFGSFWLILLIYSAVFTIQLNPALSANDFQSDLTLIINMSVLNWSGINPLIIAIFYIMGILPLVYGAFILFDDSIQPLSPYPFFIASFGLGAFALLPYFAVRQPNPQGRKKEGLLLSILDARLTAIACSLSIILLIIWGVTQGNWTDFIAQWRSSQFIHIMTIDFCILSWLLSPGILRDDLARRGIKEAKYFWLISSIPLLGILLYWCLRPQLA